MEGRWYNLPNGQPYFVPDPPKQTFQQYPWLPRTSNLQNYQCATNAEASKLPQATPQVKGRVVNDISEIMPAEIPMDGQICLFPTEDYAVIHAKYWTSDGVFHTETYTKTEEVQNGSDPQQPTLQDYLTERFDKLEHLIAQPQAQPKSKKEVPASG